MGVWWSGRFLTGIPVGRAEGEGDDEDGRNEPLVATATSNGPAAERDATVTPSALPTTAWINAPDPTVLELGMRQQLRPAGVSQCVPRSALSARAVQGG